jgi:hypothetical protein
VNFSQHEIELAMQMKSLGLAWTPAVGNYVFDAANCVRPGSPFQDGVYFILNYDCFMDRVGGVTMFRQMMTWLPTWEDARAILKQLGVTSEKVQQELIHRDALAQGQERTVLYELIVQQLRN